MSKQIIRFGKLAITLSSFFIISCSASNGDVVESVTITDYDSYHQFKKSLVDDTQSINQDLPLREKI